MRPMFDSLLWLRSSKIRDMNKEVIEDLNLSGIYKQLIRMSEGHNALIYKLCMDVETIEYRQEILHDFMVEPNFIRDLEMNLRGFYDLQSKNSEVTETLSNFYYLVDLVITVDTSIRCVEDLLQTLRYYKPKSKGLKRLKDNLSQIIEAPEYQEMNRDLKNIKHIFSKVRGLEVSINVSPVMRAYEAQVTDIVDYPYRFPKAFRKIASSSHEDRSFQGNYLKGYNPLFSLGKVHLDLMDEMEYGLREHKEVLLTFLERYKRLDTAPYVNLLEEITFYKASYDLLMQLQEQGLPLCRPRIVNSKERVMVLEDCYNLVLAVHDEHSMGHEEIIYNDMRMNKDGRIIILTGANRGGKTTITQAVGQIQIFAQLGLLVPAREATLSLVDGIYTHFPVLEKETVNLGRFGKECEGFNQIFRKATMESLLLLNESFSGTSYLESLKIAEEVVKAVKYKRIRMIYNTHLHELANHVGLLNEELANDTPIISLITGYRDGNNTYKVQAGKPLGVSHGIEIARKHKVTYDQLLERLEAKV